MYFPAGHAQSLALVLFDGLVMPDGQLIWPVAPEGQYFPAGHDLHVPPTVSL
jgi:hypothetical protein